MSLQARALAALLAPCAALLALCAGVPSPAQAAPSAAMQAKFAPERLGAATTVSLGFQITAGTGAPPALEGVELSYPSDLGFATSGLGLAECSPAALEDVGSEACPPDSRMGYGDAVVEIPIGPEIVEESVALSVFAGPSPDGYLHILVYASGVYPVEAQVVLTGVLRKGRLSIVVPPIPSLPAAPYVAVTQMHLVLGGDLTYYERVGSRTVAYHPAGVGLPRRCPHRGFPFAASFAFIDGSSARARTEVACPRHSSMLRSF